MTRTYQHLSLSSLLFEETTSDARLEELKAITTRWLNSRGKKNLETLGLQLKAQLGLSYIDKGAGRYVYSFDDTTVIKIAKENTSQNKGEVMALECLSDYKLDGLAPRLVDFDKQLPYAWILVEKVRPLNSQQFLDYFFNYFNLKENPNFDFDANPNSTYEDFHEFFSDLFYAESSFVRHYGDVFLDRTTNQVISGEELFQRFNNTELVKRIDMMLQACDFISVGDLHARNWGIGANGNLVILDLGFDEDDF